MNDGLVVRMSFDFSVELGCLERTIKHVAFQLTMFTLFVAKPPIAL